MANSTAVPNVLVEPGYLFWAPIGSTYPTHTVTGSVFTDSWPVAWINLGATDEGGTFTYETTVEPIRVAELFDPVKYATTERAGNIGFALADITLANLKRVLNGGSLSVVSGTTTTTLSLYEPPAPGTEVRCLIGWESMDATMRLICHQTLQGGTLELAFRKSPDNTTMPATFNLEVPSSGTYAGKPFAVWAAGTARG